MTTTVRQRVTNVNGATLHLTEAGDPGAPLILLSHGFPECAYSWRHQMEPLAAAGYHVIAPRPTRLWPQQRTTRRLFLWHQ